MELVRLYGVGGLAGAVNPANLKTHLGVFLMSKVDDDATMSEGSDAGRSNKRTKIDSTTV